MEIKYANHCSVYQETYYFFNSLPHKNGNIENIVKPHERHTEIH